MNEIVKTVVFRNKVWTDYEVSNKGTIRSVDRTNHFVSRNQSGSYETVHFIEGRVLKPRVNKDGYPYVGLAENGKVTTAKVHRIVAETFIENVENKPAVNHINEDKTDNSVDNLEWVTTKENNKYGSRRNKLHEVIIYNSNGNVYKHFDSLREASTGLGISRKCIKKFADNEKQLFREGGKNTFYKDYTFRLR